MDSSVLAFLKCMDGSVWSHFRFPHNLLPLDFKSWWILVCHGYYARKATKSPIWNRMYILIHPSTSRISKVAPTLVRREQNIYMVRICFICWHRAGVKLLGIYYYYGWLRTVRNNLNIWQWNSSKRPQSSC